MERTVISDRRFDEERALYNTRHADITGCVFAGPADGESVLKESRDIFLRDCSFSLRYPLWHVRGLRAERVSMDELTRAAVWYSENCELLDCELSGVKAVRECNGVTLRGCRINSTEFGWKCSGVSMEDVDVTSEYIFLDSSDITLKNVKMKGKYSFQYVDGLTIEDSELDTKDAFWHSRNVTVKNSLVKGEYLAWFSEGLTLINCRISGTQPLCYCRDLRLIGCTMEGADLSFEYSDVEADVLGHILSVKNPRSGRIVADSVGEIVREDPVMECSGEVVLRGQLH